jgi:hypothetical protein
MTKHERKALAGERDRIRAQLASIAEVKNTNATPGVRAQVELEPALFGRLEELNRVLALS